jgi:hypothetical protein
MQAACIPDSGLDRRRDDSLGHEHAVQAGMRDLVTAIRERGPPEVTPDDALLSLAVALAASDAGPCGAPFQPPPGIELSAPGGESSVC